MPGDSSDTPDSLRGRLASYLAPSEDDSASPQGRDEDPYIAGREAYREEVDAKQVESYAAEYQTNPLIRVPIQNFAADVMEPGLSVPVEAGDEDEPTVPSEGRIPPRYHGLPLGEALELWLSNGYIDGFSFDADVTDLLEEVVKDRRGRRGNAIVEHAYEDPSERDRLMALRPIAVETVTAYTRRGKSIALRPDDDAGSFDSVSVRDLGNRERSSAPTTPAGKTAAIAQFDEVFGAEERDEIPFALDDITVSTYDADTGELFGQPDSATVLNRAAALRRKFRHVDQSIVNTAFGNIIARVDSESEEVVQKVRDNLDVNVKDRGERADPETVSATNAPVELTEVDSSVPDVTEIIQQEIEFILAAMPTPLYRVGFAGDINRDVTSEQQEDYRDEVRRERRRIEADFKSVVEMKAREWLQGDPHSDEPLDVEVTLRIRPAQAESPLRDEEFDASEFASFASGLAQVAPGGQVAQVLPPHELREMVLNLDPEPPAPPGTDVKAAAGESEGAGEVPAIPAETDERVQEAFDDLYDTDLAGGDESGPSGEGDAPDGLGRDDPQSDFAEGEAALATRYEEGAIVDSPDGIGVVTDIVTEDKETDSEDFDDIQASEDSPMYVLVTEDATNNGISLFRASDLEATEIETDINPLEATKEEADATEAMMSALAPGDGRFETPPSWRKSDTPVRIIALKAFAAMGGSFTGCTREMTGEVASPDAFCGAFLDHMIYGNPYWRGDSPLPGD